MLKSKIEKLIATFAFDEIYELNKNNDVMKELRFISSIIIKIKSSRQFDAEIMNADVNVRVKIEVTDEKISAYFFTAFANQCDLS